MAVVTSLKNIPFPGDRVKRVQYGLGYDRDYEVPKKVGALTEQEVEELLPHIDYIDGASIYFEENEDEGHTPRVFSHTTRNESFKDIPELAKEFFAQGTFVVIRKKYVDENGKKTKDPYYSLRWIIGEYSYDDLESVRVIESNQDKRYYYAK